MTQEESHVIKYGGGKTVYNLLKSLDSIIANEKSSLKSTDTTPEYMYLWQEWVGTRKIFENTSKAKLQRIVLNRARAKRHEQPQETMQLILEEMKRSLPPFNEHFQYVDDPKEGAYIVTMKNEGKKLAPIVEQQDKNDPSNANDNEWMEPKTYASATKAKINTTTKEEETPQKNRYEILTQETLTPEKMRNKTENTNDSDMSYSKEEEVKVDVVEIDSDLSISITSRKDNKNAPTTDKKGDNNNRTTTPKKATRTKESTEPRKGRR